MKSKYLALILALALTGSAFAGCGDEDESQESGKTTVSSSSEDSSVEDETETTTEKGQKADGIVVRTTSASGETVTEENTEDVTEDGTEPVSDTDISETATSQKQPNKPAAYRGKTVDLAGKYASEIIELLGDGIKLESDTIPGYYRISNDYVIPGAVFYFKDESCNDIWDNMDDLGGRKPEIIEKLKNNFAKIGKITCDSGMTDEFTPGMTYADCSKIIGEFPLSGSGNGETVVGCPLSVAYSYLHENNNCIVTLHFKLSGELDRALNEGNFHVGNCSDITPTEALSFNPVLQRIEIRYAPACTNPDAVITCTSKLGDITSNGKKFTYGPENLIDGDFSTCWCEGASDVGIGQTVTWKSPTFMRIGYITVYGGLLSSQESFYKNCRPTKMIVAPHGVVQEYIIPSNNSKKYRRAIPVGYMDGIPDKYDLTITEVDSSRAEYSDTCISEIRINVVDEDFY